jgi:WXG100 family type VII secretion target
VRINYERVLGQANEIEGLGGDLQRVVSDLQTLMSEIPSSWKGDASSAYLKECEDLKVKMQNTSQNIKNVSQNIRTIARIIHDEDERMARVASAAAASMAAKNFKK